MRGISTACILLIACVGAANAQQPKIVGNWAVQVTPDRFGDGDNVVAITAQNGVAFAVRCLSGDLSGAIMPGEKLTEGDLFSVKLRADRQPIYETFGKAIGQNIMQIVTEDSFITQAAGAREIAVRVQTASGTSVQWIFNSAGSTAAIGAVVRACQKQK